MTRMTCRQALAATYSFDSGNSPYPVLSTRTFSRYAISGLSFDEARQLFDVFTMLEYRPIVIPGDDQ